MQAAVQADDATRGARGAGASSSRTTTWRGASTTPRRGRCIRSLSRCWVEAAGGVKIFHEVVRFYLLAVRKVRKMTGFTLARKPINKLEKRCKTRFLLGDSGNSTGNENRTHTPLPHAVTASSMEMPRPRRARRPRSPTK